LLKALTVRIVEVYSNCPGDQVPEFARYGTWDRKNGGSWSKLSTAAGGLHGFRWLNPGGATPVFVPKSKCNKLKKRTNQAHCCTGSYSINTLW
jgi:hypothetical protein